MRPSFKEVPPDDEEQTTCLSDDDETHGDNAYKPSALLEFLIRSCFDTETPAPSYGFVRAILQAVGQGLGEREEEDCDDGYAIAVSPFVFAVMCKGYLLSQASSGSAQL